VPKTANDPCPDGWRIPTVEEWQSVFGDASGNTLEWNNSETKGIKISPTGGTATLFIPAAGRRHYSTGNVVTANASGYYATTTAASRFYITGSRDASIDSSNPIGYGSSVRCVKEY
jgi:uncharacterized protein (TIGR02145 family)